MEPWRVVREKHNVRTTIEFSATLQLYGFIVTVSRTTKESENLPTFLLYSFIVTSTYLSSFLVVFLSSQYINTYGTWLIQLRCLSTPILFVLHYFAWCFWFPFLNFVTASFMVWCGWLLWLLWFLIGALSNKSCRNTANSLSFDLYGLVVVVCYLVLNTQLSFWDYKEDKHTFKIESLLLAREFGSLWVDQDQLV